MKTDVQEQPIAQPSGSGAGKKEEEEDMEVIDDDDKDYVQPDDGDDNGDEDEGDDDGQDQGKKKYIMTQHGKPVPPHLQNPKRSYCECGKSYSCESDLKWNKLKECGKTGRKQWVCPQCSAKFIRHQSQREHYYKVHKKQEPYKCEVCDQMFFCNLNFTEHKKEHPEHTFSEKVWDDDL